MNRPLALAVVCCAALFLGLIEREPVKLRWYKGNTHTHTYWSDGDAAPDEVASWYHERDYDFLVLSDHNILSQGERWRTVPAPIVARLRKKLGDDWVETRERDDKVQMRLKTLDELRARFEKSGEFLFIQGEEITSSFGRNPVHHNSINNARLIPPQKGESVREVMQQTMDAVAAEAQASGRPILVHLNHPNFGWGITPDDLVAVASERFFEMYNGHSGVANYGDEDHPSTEQTWDYVTTQRLLSGSGDVLYGLATDDSHNYFHPVRKTAPPGRGWVMVRAASLDEFAITEAMLRGDFYSSSGVTLRSIDATGEQLSVEVEPASGETYTIRFHGTRRVEGGAGPLGEVLQETVGTSATYRFRGDELYVRATVASDQLHPNGYATDDLKTAWTQPVVPGRSSPR